jgi:hypothetical protein
MTAAKAMSPLRERWNTTKMLTNARERLRLAAYMALTCASPDAFKAAMEKPALVNALATVMNAQIQK